MKIWIDITDLMNWSGHLTGIQRVVFNIASRIQRDYQSVNFFYYSPSDRRFYEYKINLTQWYADVTQNQQVSNVNSIKNKLTNVTPHTVKKYTPVIVKKSTIKAAKYVLMQKKRAQEFRARKTLKTNNKVANFGPGDLVVSLGNGWDNRKTFEDLGSLKKNQHFKLVSIVYDLIPIFEPQYFGGLVSAQYTDYMFEATVNCDLMIPISKSTENDIHRFCETYEISQPKTKTIRLGDEIEASRDSRPIFAPKDAFILCVGTIEVRKNHNLLYYAYKKMILENTEVPALVIAGKRGWYTNDTIMLFEQDPALSGKVIIADNTTDDELSWLYENCRFTVYPSLYEGWGLPVAESLARGKPVICSNASSIPEAGSDYAEYFSPYDAVSFANLIQKYMLDDILRKRIKIINNYRITTWEDTYNQFINLIGEVTNGD